MHPLNSQKYFGVNGIKTTFYNGSSVVSGYIVKQVGVNTFVMTDDGVTHYVRPLAQTSSIASNIAGNHGYATIPVYPTDSDATGGSFTVHYGIQSATVVTQSGTHWNVGDSLAAPSGAGALTVATLSGGNIATVTVGTAGNYTSLFSTPTTFTRAAGSGASFTAHYGVDSAANGTVMATPGTGYTAGDVLTLATSGSATVTVDTVDGSGVILTWHVSAPGTVTALGTTRAVTGGTGTGATFTPKWYILSITSSGGSGYNVGDTLIFSGITATTTPTAHISVATSHAATTVVVDTPGVGISVAPTITTSTTTATFTLKYSVISVASSGGSGYNVNDTLVFNGMVATTLPTAHLSVATSGAATTTVVDTAGVGITTAATSVTVSGVTTYAAHIYDNHLVTTDGLSMGWKLGQHVNGSAMVGVYSA